MQRETVSFDINVIPNFKQQMLNWANLFDVCCFLDGHGYNQPYNSYQCLLAAGAHSRYSPTENIFEQLQLFCAGSNDWLFGHVNYDVKNEVESLSSKGADGICFPDIFLFQPSVVIELNGGRATISSLNKHPAEIFAKIITQAVMVNEPPPNEVAISPRIEKAMYISIVEKIRQHIQRGDCYELNFCQEFFAEDATINPLQIYNELMLVSPNPYACYYKLYDKYLLCASPERYIKKMGNVIISQPIKGTARRDTENKTVDALLKNALKLSAKDRSENVMVVDLVRNDLSKICQEGTVEVEELFGIYSFPQVYQMVSTLKGVLREGIGFADILHATFPMGSMTGAPKKKVMELIEQYESTKRGIFSGTVGYITPTGDFDFNVVIRSIMYNAQSKYLNYLVGGGITFYSDPELEYEECILKAGAIEKVLKRN